MGRVVHFEIAAQDAKRATDFYEKVFNWKMIEAMPNEYWLVKTGEDNEPGIDGAIRKTTDSIYKGIKSFVCTIQVKNLVTARRKVKKAGGMLETEIMPVPGIGHFCYCKDTEGNTFGMLQTAG